MKLRNKKTGEIREIKNILLDGMFTANSLAELNEEWEDYEEPTKQFYLDCDGRIFENHTTEYIKGKMQEIGNYFETKEEAEKAVEKLKAWKRLKDKGFEITEWVVNGHALRLYAHYSGSGIKDDLDLLFGGEE